MKKTIKKAQKGVRATADSTKYYKDQEKVFKTLARSEKGDTEVSKFNKNFFETASGKAISDQLRQSRKGKPGYDANGNPLKKQKTGGSTSQRGLYDNIRANKGSGKKPTAQMLKQERKIKARKGK